MGCSDWSDRCCVHTTCDYFLGVIKLTLLHVFVCRVEYVDVKIRGTLVDK